MKTIVFTFNKIKINMHYYLCMWMLYILIVGNDLEFVQTFKGWFSSTFDMKDMGEETYILGVKIHRNCSNRIVALSKRTLYQEDP